MARRTLNVTLTVELEALIAERVESGRYLSASEVVREGLRLLEERARLRDESLVAVRRKIDEGLASLERGEKIDGETLLAELKRRIDQHEGPAGGHPGRLSIQEARRLVAERGQQSPGESAAMVREDRDAS